MTQFRILERVTRIAPIGLRFRDAATGLVVRDGLTVTVASLRNPLRRATLDVNGNAVWYARRFPGFGDALLAATPDWSAIRQPCRITVEDAGGRFLPLVVDLDLPRRGLLDWPDWGTLPQGPLAPLVDDPAAGTVCPGALPLFPAPGRTAPAAMAEVRCQFVRTDGAPAAWALLTAVIGGRTVGLAHADAAGRVAMFFPYPERPRPSLATSPPAVTDFRWPTAFRTWSDDLLPAPPPTLAALMAQLASPRDLFASTASPPATLPQQILTLGRPLTLRTSETPDGPSSDLIMAAA